MIINKSVKIVLGIIVLVILSIVIVPTKLEDNRKNEINVEINQTYTNYSNIYINSLKLQFTKIYNETAVVDNGKIYPLSGNWNIKNGEITQDSYMDAKLILGNSDWADCIIEGNFKFSKEIIRSIGIYFRYTDVKIYDAVFQDKGATYSYGTPDSGEPTPLTSYPFEPKINTWYKLKVVVLRNNMTVYIDDDLKIQIVNDNRLNRPKGKIGLRAEGQKASFRDISIKQITNQTLNMTVSYNLEVNGFTNLSLKPLLIDKQSTPSGTPSYSTIYTFPNTNYYANASSSFVNYTTLAISFPIDIIRPPDIIYFPKEPYQNSTFAIQLVAGGWDEDKQEWIFKEFMSPEFTWEDVVKGRMIINGS